MKNKLILSFLFCLGMFTANATLPPIDGTLSVCAGFTTTLSNTTTGGTWASSTTSVATITIGSGIVTGVAGGTTTITYTVGTDHVTATVTVNPRPATISGTASACVGFTSTLSDATGGGTWSSSNTAKADVDASGVVTAVAAGTATISYTLGTGCFRTTTFTSRGLPPAISGPKDLCVGTNTNLSCSYSGVGTSAAWSSSNTSIATIGVSSGKGLVIGLKSYSQI